MKHFNIAITVAFGSLLSACGADPLASRAQGLEQVPIGTFEASGSSPGEIVRMVLMADETAHLELTSSVVDGFYKRVASPRGGSLYFSDAQGQPVYSCDYEYDGKVLNALSSGSFEWQSLVPAEDAFCTTSPQCEQQELPHPTCTGQWSCINNGCQYQCQAP